MAETFFQAKAWIRHQLLSKNQHSLHSPYLFEWYNSVVRNEKGWYPSNTPEKLRKAFLKDSRLDQGKDFGAGQSMKKKRVSDYAKNSLGSRKKLSLLYRTIRFENPKSVLELGTCLGIGSSYFAEAAHGQVTTIEGNEFLLELAKEEWKENDLMINGIHGTFRDHLGQELKKLIQPWFIYLDGDHTYKGTLEYFETIVEQANQGCILVLDDIYWSADMAMAWRKILTDKRVPLSVDLFHLGLIFFRYNQPKQHFILKF